MRAYKFYSENITLGKSFTVMKHIMIERVPERTIYDILNSFEKDLSASCQYRFMEESQKSTFLRKLKD